MKSNLPKYKITIDEEYSEMGESLGITQIAFTKNPAILTKGMAFSTDKPKEKLFFGDKLKNRIVAPAMIPMEIYRSDEFEEYYVEFTEAEIERIHSKFMKNFSNRKVFNLEHNADETVPAHLLECWIVENPLEDKAFSSYGIKVPKGTVMMTAQITDKETYSQLVENEQTGFSIEGFLGLSLSEIINKNKQKQEKMEENKMMLPAGEYVMGDKTYIVKEDGTFEIKEAVEMAAEEVIEEEKVELAEEVKEEEVIEDEKVEMADEVVSEEVVAEAPVAESYSKEEVDAKFEELYKMIADLKAEEVMEDSNEEVAPLALSAHDRFAAFSRFANKSN